MGIINCFHDWGVMMMRTKPQYLSVLGRKRSSVHSPQKTPQNNTWTDSLRSFVCVVAMCCSVLCGMVLLLFRDNPDVTVSNLLIPLIIAGIASISGGLCLSEYINSRSQDVPSIYSCCYQYSSEVLAFLVGWSWLLSQAALVAAICKASALLVDHWTNYAVTKMFENFVFPHADAIPSLAFILVLVLFVITGLNETLVWYVVFIPVAFILAVVSFVVLHTSNSDLENSVDDVNWLEVQSVDQVLTVSTFCLLFFSGPQSILRVSEKKVRQKTTVVLGPLNAICFVIVIVLLFMASQSGNFYPKSTSNNSAAALSINVLQLICLCIIGVEAFYTLHFVIVDMATDGLLFRTLSKKRTPFCFPVASAFVQTLCVIGVGFLVAFLSMKWLLVLSVMFPLMVQSLVPFLVLVQRYRDNTSWQYEPMFHTTARNLRNGSRKKIQESQYTNKVEYETITENIDISTTCIDENSSDDASDTDIDSVVQQYKDQARIANMPVLEELDSSQQSPEPTPASSFRAKLSIAALFLASIINAVTLNFADLDDYFSLTMVSFMCILFSIVIMGMLLCLPQNGKPSTVFCTKIHPMPWIPGLASLLNTCLLVHCLLSMWKVYLGWMALGFFIYLAYGIRSSTAANSFYNLQPAHINLCPLPSYGNNCVPQIVPSQRKKLKSLQKNGRKKVFVT